MRKQKSNFSPKAYLLALREIVFGDIARVGVRAMQRLFGLAPGWEKHRDIVQNNYDLGCKHLALGHVRDAVFRFKVVTWLAPKHADGWYQLGCAYMAEGKAGPARAALAHALKLDPGKEEAVYMMAVAGKGDMPLPRKMPLALARQHFNRQAARFTGEQVDTYHYQGHKLLADAIRARLAPGRNDYVILELGVGTGLAGSLLRDAASQLVGVDISAAMLDEAAKLQDAAGKKIYDTLINKEIGEFLREAASESCDIVMAAGVFSYIGDVSDIVKQAARVLKPGGLLAFTADKMEGDGFKLDTSAGRFLFSKPYLEAQAAANKYKVLTCEEAPLYPDYGGWLCVFAR